MESDAATIWMLVGIAVTLGGIILLQGAASNRRMDRMEQRLVQRLDRTDQQMNQRLDRTDQQMSQRMDRMDQKMDDIRDRLARLEVIVDFIRLGMQLPRPPELAAEGPKDQ